MQVVKEKLNSLVAVGDFYTDEEDRLEQEREVHEITTREKFPGPRYDHWLQWFHQVLKPVTYVEIGVESGSSLQFAQKPTLAIGIDPDPRIVHGVNTWSKIFNLESNKFFEDYDLTDELDGAPVDFAFIDGLHHYDQALRDFLNIEIHSKPVTVVVLHDVHPAVPETATRMRNTKYWAGDTWKIMHILSKHRPDLKLYTIPAYPTSIGVITNLNPHYSVTEDELLKMINEVTELEFDVDKPVNPVPNDFNVVNRLIGV